MTISSIGATAGAAIMKAVMGASAKKEVEHTREHQQNDKKEVRGASGFIESLFKTLEQLSTPTATSSAAATTTPTPAEAGTPTTGVQGVMQAVHSFFQSLFATLRQAGSATSNASAGDSDGDNDGSRGAIRGGAFGRGMGGGLENKLQSLLATLASGGSLPAVQGAEPLDKAFVNLMNAMNGGGSPGAAPTDPANLQTFLQSWLKNLQGSGNASVSAVGNIVNSTV